MSGIDRIEKMSQGIKKKISLKDHHPIISDDELEKKAPKLTKKAQMKQDVISKQQLAHQESKISYEDNAPRSIQEQKTQYREDAQGISQNGHANNYQSSPFVRQRAPTEEHRGVSLMQTRGVFIHKTTVYYTDETKRKLDEIYANRIFQGCKTDKTALLCEAINLLYEQETKNVR